MLGNKGKKGKKNWVCIYKLIYYVQATKGLYTKKALVKLLAVH